MNALLPFISSRVPERNIRRGADVPWLDCRALTIS